MPVRTASAHWAGSITDGRGSIKASSGAVDAPYSFGSRFEERAGTNPEELLGAAHAGCFTMALALGLSEAGHPPERVDTTARVSIEREASGYRITHIVLRTDATVPGIDAGEFQRFAEAAKLSCPVSRALAGTEIELEAAVLA
ncbi:MAG: OsmC family protein [Actinomycetota bacterium]|jgi:osmotically inducible protein OsmC|nr:OsmC family protein [Actinomycetota bacterium]